VLQQHYYPVGIIFHRGCVINAKRRLFVGCSGFSANAGLLLNGFLMFVFCDPVVVVSTQPPRLRKTLLRVQIRYRNDRLSGEFPGGCNRRKTGQVHLQCPAPANPFSPKALLKEIAHRSMIVIDNSRADFCRTAHVIHSSFAVIPDVWISLFTVTDHCATSVGR